VNNRANKLIAEFMGFFVDEFNGYFNFVRKDKNLVAWEFRLQESKYHSSWDWLMPVVEKIEKIATTKMEHRRDEHSAVHWCWIWEDEDENPVAIGQSRSKIESVYTAAIDFIQWYNQQNK